MSNLLAKLKLSPSTGNISFSSKRTTSSLIQRNNLISIPNRGLKVVSKPKEPTNYPKERIGLIRHPYLKLRPKKIEPTGNRFFLTPKEKRVINARISRFPVLKVVDPQLEVIHTDLKNLKGEVIGTVELDSKVFKVPVRKDILHRSCKRFLASRRQGTHSQKTRAEVRGGGKKPRQQKGTGQSRQGSIRSVQWRGGGAAFAVKPRDYSFKLTRQFEALAMRMALSNKHSSGEFHVVKSLEVETHKSKDAKPIMNVFRDAIFVDSDEVPRNFKLATQNFPRIQTTVQSELNPYFILRHPNVVVTQDALEKIISRLTRE